MGTLAPHKPETVELVSRHPSLWLSLTPNVDRYDSLGRIAGSDKGERVVFRGGRATVPAAWMDAIKEKPEWGVSVFPAGVIQAPSFGPQVVSGSMSAPVKQTGAPFQGWDETGAVEIRRQIALGNVPDLQAALVYEFQNRKRGQVIDAITKASKGDMSDIEPGPVEQAVESVIRPLPEGV